MKTLDVWTDERWKRERIQLYKNSFSYGLKTNCQCSSSAPFPCHASAVIVTPSPLKGDVVRNTGVVITPQLGGVRFQILHNSIVQNCSIYMSLFVLLLCIIHRCQIKMCLKTKVISYKVIKDHISTSFIFLFSRLLVFTYCLTQKSPQPIVPKETSSSRDSPKAPSSVGETPVHPESTSSLKAHNLFQVFFFFPGHSQPGSSEGSPHGLDQVPSPQSLISSTTPLVKNEQNQVCLFIFLNINLRACIHFCVDTIIWMTYW